jgi:glucoamylase
MGGRGTSSATPLAWTHAEFIRLAFDIAAGRLLEQPFIVADRYLRDKRVLDRGKAVEQ